MCRTQYVLALLALYVGLVHSFPWDFATASGSQLEFYFHGSHTHTEKVTFGDIKLITYDAVGNRMFFVDRESTDTAIFSFDLSTKTIESVVHKSSNMEHIMALAFDPVEELLFWSEPYSDRISWFSLKPGFENNIYGNLLIEISPTASIFIFALAVDSCRGYIYWTSSVNKLSSTIERARFDGSEREVIIDSNLQILYHLVLDQQTQKLYWSHGTPRDMSLATEIKQFFVESADLNGKNRTILKSQTKLDQPMALAVSKDYIIYSVSPEWFHGTVCQLSKNSSIQYSEEISTTGSFRVLATNYKIDDQIRGIQDCEGLKRLLPNNSVTNDNVSLNISSEVSLVCIHGIKVSGKSQCECTHGYTGERCDVSVCQNYCFQGDCIVSAKEQPTCRCKAGYSGERCEINICRGYCLNDGICSFNEKSEPVCQCKGYYEGERCDVSTRLNKCFQKVVSMVWDIINEDVTPATLDEGVKSTYASTAA